MATVDSLDIQISASANKANVALASLANKIDRVSVSLSSVNSRGLATLGAGVNKLSNAMANFSNNTKTADFSRLARNLNALSSIDASAISNASSSLTKIANGMKAFENIKVSDSAKQLTEFATGIKQLGYTSANKAIENIPKLSDAVKDLMKNLSTAPKVSQNLIDMTNALAKLARTGTSSGRAADALSKSFTTLSNASLRATRNLIKMPNVFKSIAKSILPILGIRQLFNWGKQAMEVSSDLTEVQNVIDVTFGNYKQKIEDLASISITDFGMSELTAKQIAGRFQAMGTAIGFSQGKMSDMSVELTKLAGDMASFYNVEQEDVARSLQAIFTGESEPLRKYGLDLTQTTLQEWALKEGIDANIQSMSQAEKTMLRYQYVMSNTAAAQGDFARTANTWANSIRVLKQNFEALGSIVGQVLINVFKPFVQALNSVMQKVIQFAKVVANSLGKIFGWEIEISATGITDDIGSIGEYADQAAGNLEDGSDAAKDEASNLEKAQKAAKKLKNTVFGFDQLHILNSNDVETLENLPNSLGSLGGGINQSGTGDVVSELAKTESVLDAFKSDIDNLYDLGEYIGKTLTDAMNSIDWDAIYEKARNFGKGLADFLNGLISPELFGALGKTIAGSLNTALQFLNSFGETFEWKEFGLSLATGLNEFFSTFDFALLADTINTWAHGILDTIIEFLDKTDWEMIGEKIGIFLSELDISGIASKLAQTLWKAIKAAFELLKGMFEEAPLETSLIAAFSVLKFTGLGKFVATKISQVIAKKLASALGVEIAKEAGIGTAIKTGISKHLPSLSTTFTGISQYIPHIAIAGAIVSVGKEIKEQMQNLFNTEDWGIGDWIVNTLKTSLSGWKSEFDNFKISLELWWQDTWMSDAIWKFGQWWDEKIAPWFTQEQWSELWESVKTAFSTKWQEIVGWWNESAIGKWWSENVTPWFEIDSWSELFSKIHEALSGVWSSLVEWWNESALGKWWNDNVLPWFEESDWSDLYSVISKALESVWNGLVEWWENSTLGKWWEENVSPWFEEGDWSTLFGVIKTTLKGIWDETVGQWISDITDWWDNDVAPWFDLKTWTDLLSKIPGIFSDAFNRAKENAIGKIKEMYDKIVGWVDDMISKIQGVIDKMKEAVSSKSSSSSSGKSTSSSSGKFTVPKITIPTIKIPTVKINIPKYATGGFPEDGLFMANHGELLGKFANGKTAVANNEQIITGIENAVYRAMMSVAQSGSFGGNGNIMVNAVLKTENDEVLARAVTRGQEKLDRRYKPSAP